MMVRGGLYGLLGPAGGNATGGRVSIEHPIDLFIELREQTLKGWRAQQSAADRALRSPTAIAQAHYLLIGLGSWALGTFTIVSPLAQRLQRGSFSATPDGLAFVVTFLVWTLLIALPGGAMRGPHRTWLLLLYSLIGAPLMLAIGEAVARSDTSQLPQNMILLPIFSFVFLLLTIALIFIVGGSIPGPLFLLLTSVRSGKRGLVLPSYETIIRDVDAQIAPLLDKADTGTLSQLALIGQHKQAGVNGRLQTLALVSGVLALLGLAALVVAEGSVGVAINGAIQAFSRMLGTTTPDAALPSGVGLVLVGLGLFVVLILWYALQTYRELRLLEIINVICALRLVAAQTPAAAAPVAPAPARAASAPVPTAQPRPILLLVLVLGLALARRVLRRW